MMGHCKTPGHRHSRAFRCSGLFVAGTESAMGALLSPPISIPGLHRARHIFERTEGPQIHADGHRSSLDQSHLRQSVFICGPNQPRISIAAIVRATISRLDVAAPIGSIEVPIDLSDVASPLIRCIGFGSASTDSQWRRRPIISSDAHYCSLRLTDPKIMQSKIDCAHPSHRFGRSTSSVAERL